MDADPSGNCLKQKKYSSVLYDLPDELAGKVIEWGKNSIPDSALFVDQNGDRGRATRIHCTLIWGTFSPHLFEIYQLLTDERSFAIELGEISCFENCEFDVVKINIIGGDLFRINQKLKRELQVIEHYPYSPHITIAYVKQGLGKQFITAGKFRGTELFVDALNFYDSSSQSVYRCPLKSHSNNTAYFPKVYNG